MLLMYLFQGIGPPAPLVMEGAGGFSPISQET